MSDKQESILKRKCVTPKFRGSYVNVFEPTAIDEDADKKFNITMLFDKDDDLKVMRRAVHNAAVEAWGKDKSKWPKKRRMPFRDGDEEKPDNPEYAGKYFVYASSKEDNPPGVYDQKKRPITAEMKKLKSGDYMRASLIAFHYKVAGNEGISFALLSVQKWEDGEALGGGRSADDFDDSLEDMEDEPETLDEDFDDEDDDFLK